MIDVLLAGIAMLFFVFFKSFQQRNVAFDSSWLLVMLFSLAMAFTEAYVIVVFVTVGYNPTYIIAIGTGAGIGALLGRYLHRRLHEDKT